MANTDQTMQGIVDEHIQGEHHDAVVVDCPECRKDAEALGMPLPEPVVVDDHGPVAGGKYECTQGHQHATATDANVCSERHEAGDPQNLQDVIEAIEVAVVQQRRSDTGGWFPKGVVQGLYRAKQIAEAALPKQDAMIASIGASSFDTGYEAAQRDVADLINRYVAAAQIAGDLDGVNLLGTIVDKVKALNPMTGEVIVRAER